MKREGKWKDERMQEEKAKLTGLQQQHQQEPRSALHHLHTHDKQPTTSQGSLSIYLSESIPNIVFFNGVRH